MQTRMYVFVWSDEKKCRGCDKEGPEKHRSNHCPRRIGELGAQVQNVGGGSEIVSENKWRKATCAIGTFSVSSPNFSFSVHCRLFLYVRSAAPVVCVWRVGRSLCPR